MKKGFFLLSTVMFLLIFCSYGYAFDFEVSTATEFQDALSSADQNGENDVITLAPGTYDPNDIVSTFVYNSGSSEVGTLKIVGDGEVILDGDSTLPVLWIESDLNNEITLENLTIHNGFANDSGAGAGIRMEESGDIYVINCSFKNNTVTGDPGGGLNIFIGDTGSVNISSCDFTGNSASRSGGATYIRNNTGNITIANTVFDNNISATESSGALDVSIKAGNISLSNNIFSNNESDHNTGAAYLQISDSTGLIEVYSCDFTGNRTYGHEAGALCVSNYGEGVSITNSRFEKNVAETDGGGAYLSCQNGFVLVQNCLFTNNSSSRDGAGLYLSSDAYSPAKPTSADIINNTITGNVVSEDNYGGGLYVRCGDPDTVYSFYNNIIWGNSAGIGADMYLKDENQINSYSFNISNNDFSVISHDLSESSEMFETANIDDDPLFVSATDFRLQEGSPVIDMGDSNAPSLPEVDLVGNARIYGDAVDMGAYEFTPEVVGDDDDDDSTPVGDDDDDDNSIKTSGGSSGCNAGIFVPSMLLLIAPLLLLVRKR